MFYLAIILLDIKDYFS